MASNTKYMLAETLRLAPSGASPKIRWALLTHFQKVVFLDRPRHFLAAETELEKRCYAELLRLKLFETCISTADSTVLYRISDLKWNHICYSAELSVHLDQTHVSDSQNEILDARIDGLIEHLLTQPLKVAMTYSCRLVLLSLLIYCNRCGIVMINTTEIRRLTGLAVSTVNLALTELRNFQIIRQTVKGYSRQDIFQSSGATHLINISHPVWGASAIFGNFFIMKYTSPRRCEVAKILDLCDAKPSVPPTDNTPEKLTPYSLLTSESSIGFYLKKISETLAANKEALNMLKAIVEKEVLLGLDNTAFLLMLQTRIELMSTYFLNHNLTPKNLSYLRTSSISTIPNLLFAGSKTASDLHTVLLPLIELQSRTFRIMTSAHPLPPADFFSALGQSSVLPQNRLDRSVLVFYTRARLTSVSNNVYNQLWLFGVEPNEDGYLKTSCTQHILEYQSIDSQIEWGLLTRNADKKSKSRAQTETKK